MGRLGQDCVSVREGKEKGGRGKGEGGLEIGGG